jgi:type II secretory pathway predicted ATPase ExeA
VDSVNDKNMSLAHNLGDGTHEVFRDGEVEAGGTDQDFLDHFGLNEQPFGVTPDPHFLFLGSKHRQALAALNYGTKSNRGFVALIAKPGMGKTSLLFQYLESQRDKARTAFVFQTDGNATDFMRYLLTDLNLDAVGKDLAEMRSMLNDVLIQEMNAGRRFILIIDEAQNFDEKVLESIRLLSNFETPWAKLMQIVMAGQTQLAECLGRTSMTQLRQRISLFIKLEPFTSEETEAYIGHRLKIAGYQGEHLFTAGALRKIAESSNGTPRMINNICFAAMSLAWMLKRNTIDRDTVTDVLDDLSPELITDRESLALTPADAKPKVLRETFSVEDVPFNSVSPLREARSQIARPEQARTQTIHPGFGVDSSSSRGRNWPVRLAAIALVLFALGWSYVYVSASKEHGVTPKVLTPVSTASGQTWKPVETKSN